MPKRVNQNQPAPAYCLVAFADAGQSKDGLMASPYDDLIAKFGGADIWEIYKGFPNYSNDKIGQCENPDMKRLEHAIIFNTEVLRVTITQAAEKICQAIKAKS